MMTASSRMVTPCEPHGFRPVGFFFGLDYMVRDRVISLIDGFNLYHAIARLKQLPLEWLDLQALSRLFIGSQSEELTQVFYFSTLAIHTSEATQKRQTAYFTALKLNGVNLILGQFKKKDRYCPKCASYWTGYEEKETDVNIALTLLELSFQNAFDRALLVSNDSDLAPAVRKVLGRFPDKRITIVAPPLSRQCNELIQAASDKSRIHPDHLKKCLLPEKLQDKLGRISIARPREYSPLN